MKKQKSFDQFIETITPIPPPKPKTEPETFNQFIDRIRPNQGKKK